MRERQKPRTEQRQERTGTTGWQGRKSTGGTGEGSKSEGGKAISRKETGRTTAGRETGRATAGRERQGPGLQQARLNKQLRTTGRAVPEGTAYGTAERAGRARTAATAENDRNGKKGRAGQPPAGPAGKRPERRSDGRKTAEQRQKRQSGATARAVANQGAWPGRPCTQERQRAPEQGDRAGHPDRQARDRIRDMARPTGRAKQDQAFGLASEAYSSRLDDRDSNGGTEHHSGSGQVL